jgi:hypothetical protein
MGIMGRFQFDCQFAATAVLVLSQVHGSALRAAITLVKLPASGGHQWWSRHDSAGSPGTE